MYRYGDKGMWPSVGLFLIVLACWISLGMGLYPPTEQSSYEIKEYAVETIFYREEKVPLLGIDKLTIEVTYRDESSTLHRKIFKGNSFCIDDDSYIKEKHALYWGSVTYELYLSEEDYFKIRNLK